MMFLQTLYFMHIPYLSTIFTQSRNRGYSKIFSFRVQPNLQQAFEAI